MAVVSEGADDPGGEEETEQRTAQHREHDQDQNSDDDHHREGVARRGDHSSGHRDGEDPRGHETDRAQEPPRHGAVHEVTSRQCGHGYEERGQRPREGEREFDPMAEVADQARGQCVGAGV